MATKAAPAAPLYEFENGSRKYLQSGNYIYGNGWSDVRVSNGNHFYFYKRWGDNAVYTLGELTVNGAPFTLTAGDVVRTVLKFDTATTTGGGLRIIAGPTKNSYNGSGNVTLLTASVTSSLTAEATVTIPQTLATGAYNFFVNPTANTSNRTWEGDIEIYVNDVRYI